MVFRSYMDEAGIQTSDPYCSIAGYVAPIDEWNKFERDWRFILDDYMVNILELDRYFHALEFYGNHKKYRTWSSAKRKSCEAALFRAINDRELALFMSTIDSAVFFSMTVDERRYLTGGQHNGIKWKHHGAPSKPYFLPFQFCMIQSANFIRDGDKVFPVMSWQEQYKMKAVELYKLMLNTEPPLQCRDKLADEVVFSNPKKVAALQASDLAVYWFGQFNNWKKRTQSVFSEGYPDRVQLMRLMNNVRSFYDLKLFDFKGIMISLGGCNRYVKTSFPTLDQQLDSVPVRQRLEILSSMRKVNFRKFLDQWRPGVLKDHG